MAETETLPAGAITMPQGQDAPAPSGSRMADAFGALDTLGGNEPADGGGDGVPPSNAGGAKPASPDPKPTTSKGTPAANPATKAPTDGTGTGQKPSSPTDGQPVKAKDLRTAKEMAEKRAAELEAKLAEIEKERATPKPHPKETEWASERESLTKKQQDYEDRIRLLDYRQSDEYGSKYVQPFNKAWDSAKAEITKFRVNTPEIKDDVTGEIKQSASTRSATEDDFQKFMSFSDPNDAAEFAEKMFGRNYVMALNHRQKLSELKGRADEAVADYASKGQTWAKEKSEAQSREEKLFGETYASEIKRGMEHPDYKDWFNPDPADTKGQEYFKKGMSEVDKILDAKERDSLPKPQQAARLAAMRNKAGAFDYLAHRFHSLKAENAALQAKLEGFEKSEPNLTGDGGHTTKTGTAKGMDAFDAEANRMAGITG